MLIKTLITSLCLMFFANSFAQELPTKIKWYTLEEAVALNKKNPKKIFIDVYTDWCGWCKKLDAIGFAHPIIVKYMNEHFYPVKFNAETKDTLTLNGQQYLNRNPLNSRSPNDLAVFLLNGRMGYPSLVVLDEKLNKADLIQSYLQPQYLEAYLKFIQSNSYKTQTINEYIQTFKGEIE